MLSDNEIEPIESKIGDFDSDSKNLSMLLSWLSKFATRLIFSTFLHDVFGYGVESLSQSVSCSLLHPGSIKFLFSIQFSTRDPDSTINFLQNALWFQLTIA